LTLAVKFDKKFVEIPMKVFQNFFSSVKQEGESSFAIKKIMCKVCGKNFVSFVPKMTFLLNNIDWHNV